MPHYTPEEIARIMLWLLGLGWFFNCFMYWARNTIRARHGGERPNLWPWLIAPIAGSIAVLCGYISPPLEIFWGIGNSVVIINAIGYLLLS